MKQLFLVTVEMSGPGEKLVHEDFVQDVVFNRINHDIMDSEDKETGLSVNVVSLRLYES